MQKDEKVSGDVQEERHGEQELPSAGPHAKPSLTNPDATPRARARCRRKTMIRSRLRPAETGNSTTIERASALHEPAVSAPSVPRIVIVGGGFGGLEAAKSLAGLDAEVILIDQKNHHCFQPLLYQVATAALSPADVAWPIRGILHRQRNARVILAHVTGIDAGRKRVYAAPIDARLHPERIEIAYDYLVLATGSTHSYFGHEEWAGVAPGLKRIEDAIEIRRRILLAFEEAEIAPEEERRALLTFVIVGGGPTGVEMAGAIAEIARQTLVSDFRSIDPRLSRVVLVEAGPRILPSFPEDLSEYAVATLRRMGVEVLVSTKVTQCDPDGVSFGDHRMESRTLIWAAGVVASPAANWIGAEQDRAGRIKVAADLSVPARPEIFAIGDTAAVIDAAGSPVPGLAPAAKQMGRYVGRSITRRIRGGAALPAFRYRDYGNLATIGRKAAVVALGRLHLTGLIGWLFWSSVHIYFLISLRNRFIVALQWSWNYITFQRSARLIT
jgi:NADH:ubiquinone reductase (H+-translocating)